MDQYRTPLFDAIRGFIDEGNAPLHIPSHKLGQAIHPKWKAYAGDEIFKMDLCEVQGLDDLHQPKGAIQESQQLAADAWGARESYFLVNGTSSGIIASICTVCGEGDKIIVPRNAHKSVVFGLIVSGAVPLYVNAEIDRERGLVGGFLPSALARVLDENPGAKAVFGVSPTYHGVCSDMKGLIDATHAHGGLFIADEAHGNHVYFHEDLPSGALALGADFACQSIHKMSGSLTQSSMLHIGEGCKELNGARLRACLQMAQNTSPSYLLQASLDLARSYIATEGHDLLDNLIGMVRRARERLGAIHGVDVLGPDLIGGHGIFDYEPIRLVVSARKLGIEGYELYEILRRDYRIEMEFGDYYYGVCVLGLGTQESDLDRLVQAMDDLSGKWRGRRAPLAWDEELPPMPPMLMTPREAFFAERESVPWRNAKGRISAELIVPYPPGIPTICPGEPFTDEVWGFLDSQYRNGRHLHGPKNGQLDEVNVVAE
ncbi:MAG: DegT/DnrJ/EryC1/StrS family aminotransferase [Clostridiales Family XIII bacterium]|jgi:arginine/lysine/ornithine decarboxylase|nr:DegT/DnrJ/EryC1/StrS family aminotransferase [Clostridiales Family XIII bacterium]